METKQYIVAIEIGSSKIVGAIAVKDREQGNVAVIATEKVEAKECVRYGCIKNVEETKHHIRDVISSLEKRMNTDKVDSKITGIYLSIAGRSVRNITSQVSSHLSMDTAITQTTINALLQEGRQVSMKGFDVLDVVPRRFLVDNVEVKKPVGTFGTDISATLNTIVGKSVIKTNLNRVLDPNIKVHNVILTPLALADGILSADERQLGCMLIDMGAETTTIAIYKNDALFYLATLPLGGRNITRDIMHLNLLEEKAEELKISVGNAMTRDNSRNKVQVEGNISIGDISKYVSARCGEIVTNIVQQLEDAGVKADELGSGIVIVGGAAKLNGFVELLEKSIKMKVRRGDYPSHVNILDSEAQQSDAYLQVVAIAAKAAEIIDADDTCVERQVKPTPMPEPKVEQEEDKEPEKEPEPKPKPKKENRFTKALIKLKNIFEESDEDDVDDNY